ncbi:diadenylate cyclase CdaA [Turicibacter sp. TJ11]|uniref:diadenylate cyclase CdaA n=1 Tax=Turicibacter sp. TJ11 TaxID=2806443 RepID=UPI001F18D60F|nr:diadenylate cyclase CdaA [Turicibacter sp. TJ11]
MINTVINSVDSFKFFDLLLVGLDIYFVWLIIYYILKLIKSNVRAVQILKGVILIYIIDLVSQIFDLYTLNSLIGNIIDWGLLAIIIIFQPEIRSGLEQIGRNSTLNREQNKFVEHDVISILANSVEFLAKRRIGALIVIERGVKLDEFITPSTIIDGEISQELLTTIFVPTTPLHDGAIMIREEKLYCAGAYLPSTRREDINKSFGTRHRAAIGISEISDSVTLVVSEETGRYSIAYKGELKVYDRIDAFKNDLKQYLG